MASGIYTQFKSKLMQKAYNLDTDVIKVALYDSGHVFTASDTTYTSTNELPTGSGYTRDSKVLTSQVVSISGTSGKWAADNVTWTFASFSAYHCVLYNDSVGKDLICSIDFGGEQTVTGGTFVIEWTDDGIITIS